jgi:hypothetical protein
MKPIKFKEANVTFAENQPEYIPLPAWNIRDKVYQPQPGKFALRKE